MKEFEQSSVLINQNFPEPKREEVYDSNVATFGKVEEQEKVEDVNNDEGQKLVSTIG